MNQEDRFIIAVTFKLILELLLYHGTYETEDAYLATKATIDGVTTRLRDWAIEEEDDEAAIN